MKHRRILLGCIADDFTGASDAASFMMKGGLTVQLFNGVPEETCLLSKEVNAVVIALKLRSQKTQEAIQDALNAVKWLQKINTEKYYFKYCSTFDSSPTGNIGPVADAIMDYLGLNCSVLCPALPANGRIVRNGMIFVNGVPLDESPMRNHPITPMKDSRIKNLMSSQSRYSCIEIGRDNLSWLTKEDIMLKYNGEYPPCYYIPDYETEEDGIVIANKFGDLTFLTGGSGLLEPLSQRLKTTSNNKSWDPSTDGRTIILAGSCSKATLEQIDFYKHHGGISYKVNPVALLQGIETPESIWEFVQSYEEQCVLVYSSESAERIKDIQKNGKEKVAEAIEQCLAKISVLAYKNGYNRIIVAGGETSGAVIKMLKFNSFLTGTCIAPGVPIMKPLEQDNIRLVLKSGNFGNADFFCKAMQIMGNTHSFHQNALSEDQELEIKLNEAVQAARLLFNRNKTSGSSANISFRHKDTVYISQSGTCFGTLEKTQFTGISLDGTPCTNGTPSKEWPLHLSLYRNKPEMNAVIHTHSTYCVLWSLIESINETDCIPCYTPYLKMKLGTVGLIPFNRPGSKELFESFENHVQMSDGYILKNHGPVIPGKTIMDAFYNLEELEESAKIAWITKQYVAWNENSNSVISSCPAVITGE